MVQSVCWHTCLRHSICTYRLIALQALADKHVLRPETSDISPSLVWTWFNHTRYSANISSIVELWHLYAWHDVLLLCVLGNASNIYFHFDIVSDTPIDVANEMVKELDITDREPAEIAEMIAQAISAASMSGCKEGVLGDWPHVYNYVDDEQEGSSHPFYCLSSPASSQGSSVFGMSSSRGIFCQQHNHHQADWLGGMYKSSLSTVLTLWLYNLRITV